jgi:hypothetical protein
MFYDVITYFGFLEKMRGIDSKLVLAASLSFSK